MTAPAPPGMHQCPVRRCHEHVPGHLLMCPVHWAKVARPIRDAVWNTFRLAPGSRAHAAAIRAAVASVNAKETGR